MLPKKKRRKDYYLRDTKDLNVKGGITNFGIAEVLEKSRVGGGKLMVEAKAPSEGRKGQDRLASSAR